MRASSPALVLAPRPRVAPRPGPRTVRTRPGVGPAPLPSSLGPSQAPEAAPDEASVIAYLAALSDAARADVVRRAEQRARDRSADALPFDLRDRETPAFELVPRAAARTMDLEDIDEETREAPARSTVPPPLPSRARRPRLALPFPPAYPPAATSAPAPAPSHTSAPTSVPTLTSAPAPSHGGGADEVLDALGDLSLFATLPEAACFCLYVAMRVVPALGGLVAVRDPLCGGYVVLHARGPHSPEIVRTRLAEDDPIVSMALVRGGPLAVDYGDGRLPPRRHAVFGDPWSAFVAPAQDAERCLAVLELVDPLEGRTLGGASRRALETIAQALATFARERPCAVDRVFAPEQLGLED